MRGRRAPHRPAQLLQLRLQTREARLHGQQLALLHRSLLPREIAGADYVAFTEDLKAAYPWMPRALRNHYGRLYGARTRRIVGQARSLDGLGRHFGGHLYEAEVRYLVQTEWARTADDILRRRTKEYLHMTEAEQAALADWLDGALAASA